MLFRFLLAHFLLESLKGKRTVNAVRQAIRLLPFTTNTYQNVYEESSKFLEIINDYSLPSVPVPPVEEAHHQPEYCWDQSLDNSSELFHIE